MSAAIGSGSCGPRRSRDPADDTSRPPSLRERKKQRTREALQTVALSLFERNGFDATTIAEVAAKADVSPRTVFRYFSTKQDLVFGDATGDLERLLDALASRPAGEAPFAAVAAALIELAPSLDNDLTARRWSLVTSNPVLFVRALHISAEWATAIAAELARRQGIPEPDLRLRLAAEIGQRVLVSSLREWVRRGALSGAFVDVLRESLGTLTLLVS